MKTRLLNRRLSALLISLTFALTALSVTGCGQSVEYDDTRPPDEQDAVAQPLNKQVFASAADVKAWRDAGEAIILDTRAVDAFKTGHIKGAFSARGGSEFQTDLGLVNPDVVLLQSEARKLGLRKDKKIVIYGAQAGSGSGAGRLFWTLEYLGHGEVYLYADGYETLLSQLEEEPEAGEVTPPEGDFVVALRPSILAPAEEVRRAAAGEIEAVLIDTRREAEYLGTEDRGDPRQGAIPNAVWYHWENVFDAETKLLRPKAELEAELTQNGLYVPGKLTIPYCQTGVRSGTIYAILRSLGHTNVKNYDGSWVEWSRDATLPIVNHQQ